MDIGSAFDQLQLNYCLRIFKGPNVRFGITLLTGIEAITTRLKLHTGKVTDKLSVNRWLRQGDSISPLSFNVVMNEIKLLLSDQCKGGNKRSQDNFSYRRCNFNCR